MKKSFIILLCIFMPCLLMAQESLTQESAVQEPAKRKEIGLVFRNLDNFGLTFRTGTDKALWRFNTLFLGGNSIKQSSDSVNNKQGSSGFEIGVGKEYRKLVANKLELRLGGDLSFGYSKSKSEYTYNGSFFYNRKSKQTYYMPGVRLVLGLNYVLNSNLVIGAELLPSVSYSIGTSEERDTNSGYKRTSDVSGLNYGLTNSSALLSVAYRF